LRLAKVPQGGGGLLPIACLRIRTEKTTPILLSSVGRGWGLRIVGRSIGAYAYVPESRTKYESPRVGGSAREHRGQLYRVTELISLLSCSVCFAGGLGRHYVFSHLTRRLRLHDPPDGSLTPPAGPAPGLSPLSHVSAPAIADRFIVLYPCGSAHSHQTVDVRSLHSISHVCPADCRKIETSATHQHPGGAFAKHQQLELELCWEASYCV
jgi:hypothetical protein